MEILMEILKEIKEKIISHFNSFFPELSGKYEPMDNNPMESAIFKEIEDIVIKNPNKLGYFKTRKIKKMLIKIDKIFDEIRIDVYATHEKYYKRFYKELQSMDVY